MAHNHCHNGCHDHDHSSSEELGIQYNLYEKIDKENLQCLNESVEGSGKTVFKSWDKRFDTVYFVESDADEELLFNIPFTGNVKLKGIKIASENTDAHPSKLRLFKNKPNMTFDDVTLEPDQVFELHRDTEGILEYAPNLIPPRECKGFHHRLGAQVNLSLQEAHLLTNGRGSDDAIPLGFTLGVRGSDGSHPGN